MTTGSLSVLNVGAGDIEIRFNQHDDVERDRALKMLVDMQRRGYAILVRLDDGSYVRAKEIDHARGCYIVQLPDGSTHEAAEPITDAPPPGSCGCGQAVAEGKTWVRGHHNRKRKGTSYGSYRVPIKNAHATGVARSAGG